MIATEWVKYAAVADTALTETVRFPKEGSYKHNLTCVSVSNFI